MIKDWDELPDTLRTEEVEPYYNLLKQKRLSYFFKRVFDFLLAFIMLGFLSPVFLIIAIVIKADSPGPVFFRQTRITQYGREFRIIKFRTMIVAAEKISSQVTVKEDSRITRSGKILRKLRLDEIPQLINILSGDMSFVGTRPEVKKYVDAYTPEMMATLLLPAGVTSLASIKFKDESCLLLKTSNVDEIYIKEVLPKKMVYNLQEIVEFSFWGDIRIMFMTICAVLGKEF